VTSSGDSVACSVFECEVAGSDTIPSIRENASRFRYSDEVETFNAPQSVHCAVRALQSPPLSLRSIFTPCQSLAHPCPSSLLDIGLVVTMEDQQFERYIVQQSNWESLPLDVRKRMGNSKDTWRQNVCRYSIRHQLRWKTNLVKSFIPDEKAYYTEVLRFSRVQYMVRSLSSPHPISV